MDWQAYNELAWIEEILGPVEEYEEEVEGYLKWLKRYSLKERPSMLHLGCGAGGHDYHFKQAFDVTGVDLSRGMLKLAEKRNPELTYIHGDMRDVQLNETFDLIMIPDSVFYMNTKDDLHALFKNAVNHLASGGLLFIVTHFKEHFMENNFVYTGEKSPDHVTMFESNKCISDHQYEATMVFLIRHDGELTIKHDVHTLGLFTKQEWVDLYHQYGFDLDINEVAPLYDDNVFDDGEYPLTAMIGVKQ
ncbi:Methyltransferase domain-containing protein [Pelagirhabdus alkalitolerans]|uniref:Methyltransferase domain-containing protein n=1 Tax=Pelagirhabdus alkalitolerans TaxID=1612202 RepID=A0A1G6INL2_9BACI|nr:class I SAM-dependent methyltransferase [Pelagirhabdus alkalitolerans]SDC08089.1 Methyltransferase domain-containing protein [Pelagirhabdus alkalitolerans]